MKKFSLPVGQVVGRSCWLERESPKDEMCLIGVRTTSYNSKTEQIFTMVVRCKEGQYCHAAAVLSLEGSPLPERPEVRTEVATPDAAPPDASVPDAARSDAARPDAPRAEAPEPQPTAIAPFTRPEVH